MGSGGATSVLPGGGTPGTPTAGTNSGGSTGTAGSAPTAGTAMGGSAPIGGATPAAGTGAGGDAVGGSAGSGGGSGLPGGPTAGCGKASADEPNKDVLHNLTVGGEARRYWTKIPQTYDGTTAMPVVFYGPGCGASGVEGAPLDASIRDHAIRVFVIGTGSCFSTGEAEPETGYFNAVLDEVQANYCTDKGKVFVSGYSSGGWLSMLLACTTGDRITAIGSAAGGFRATKFGAMCKGNPAAMFHAGTGDTANPITRLDDQGNNYGSSAGRDNLIMRNGCTMETKTWDPAFPECKEYVGCSSPVIWCEENVGHSNGEEVARTGWWKFWSGL
jgi:polyhydroxybutyrate depolymerase